MTPTPPRTRGAHTWIRLLAIVVAQAASAFLLTRDGWARIDEPPALTVVRLLGPPLALGWPAHSTTGREVRLTVTLSLLLVTAIPLLPQDLLPILAPLLMLGLPLWGPCSVAVGLVAVAEASFLPPMPPSQIPPGREQHHRATLLVMSAAAVGVCWWVQRDMGEPTSVGLLVMLFTVSALLASAGYCLGRKRVVTWDDRTLRDVVALGLFACAAFPVHVLVLSTWPLGVLPLIGMAALFLVVAVGHALGDRCGARP